MKVKNLILGLAITILASFVAIYGIKAFYGDTPNWEDFCGPQEVKSPQFEINNSVQCEDAGGNWNSFTNSPKMEFAASPGVSGYCDFYYECQKQFDEAQKDYSKNLFLVTIPVGVVLIAIGAVLFSLEAIGAGIMLSGIVTLIFGATTYWPSANNVFRFLISLAGLVIVIFIGYWINREVSKEKGFKKILKKFKR